MLTLTSKSKKERKMAVIEREVFESATKPSWDVDYPRMFYWFGPRWSLTERVAGYIAIVAGALPFVLCLLSN